MSMVEIKLSDARDTKSNLLMITKKGEMDTLYVKNGRKITLWSFRSVGIAPSYASFDQDILEPTKAAHSKNCRFFEIGDDLADKLILAWAKAGSFDSITSIIPEQKEAT